MEGPARRSPNSRDAHLHAWRGFPHFEGIVEQSRAQREETCAALLLRALRRLRRVLTRRRKPVRALPDPALRHTAMPVSRTQ